MAEQATVGGPDTAGVAVDLSEVLVAPVSFAQQQLWLVDRMGGPSAAYSIPAARRLRGRLDAAALAQALEGLVRRHETLRTTFTEKDGTPIQVIWPAVPFHLPVDELPAGESPDDGVQRHVAEEALRPFDLERGPLFRARLLRLSAEEHVLLLTMHHIASDGWSMGVLFRELGVLYSAFSRGEPDPLPELELQYADYATWQREHLRGEVLERQLAYWKAQLDGAPALLDLPLDRPRAPTQSQRGERERIRVPAGVMEALEGRAREEGATLYMVLLAAFQVLLSRYSGQASVVVGSPTAGRGRPELEPLVGCFVNTLAMRADLAGDPTFRELLRQARERMLGAYEHQELPFEKLVEELRVERSRSYNPVFQAFFALHNAPAQRLALPGLALETVDVNPGITKFDLMLLAWEQAGELQGVLQYSADLFDRETAARMAEHLQVLLEEIAADPDRRVSALPLLTQAERARLLVEWNATGRAYPEGECLHELFEAQVRRAPGAVALVDGARRLTYAELEESANRLAHHLRGRGVGPEVRVGLCMERSPEMVVALLAVLKAGGAYVPLDPAYPSERLAYMLADSRAAVLLAQEHLAGRLAGHPAAVVCPERDREAVAASPADAPRSGATPESLAYVIYTSGSTGRPKGVAVTHRGVVNYLSWAVEEYGVGGGPGAPLHSSLSFDLTVTSLFAPLLAGAPVVLLPDAPGAEALAGALRGDEGFGLVKLTPSHLAALNHQLPPAEVRGRVRTLVVGGENLLAEVTAPWQALAPGVEIVNEYGPTEATVGCCVYRLSPEREESGSVRIGRPVPNTRVYVLDGHMEPAPTGVEGELYVGGVQLARGYLGRPELTAEKFVPDPFGGVAGERLYRTGDRACWRGDGTLDFRGRVDEQVKIRGYRIEPGEVEAVLAQHPRVRECVVAAREDEARERQLVAYLVPEGEAPAAAELRAHLRESLPEHMVPEAFVLLDRVPLTANGKVDRRALPAPGEGPAVRESVYVAPRTPTEEVVAAIWAEALRLDRVGSHDAFFELGGNSLRAIQVASRCQKAFGVPLSLTALFEDPTVARLAGRIDAARLGGERTAAPPIVHAAREHAPLSFAQQRLWFLDRMEPGGSTYNIPVALRLLGALDVEALERSLGRIVRRHAVLRTTFTVVDGEPVQVPAPEMELRLHVEDLPAAAGEELAAEVRRQTTGEARRPFDLERGPPFRARLLRLSPEDHVLLLTMHHIVSDGWSMGVLFRELSVLYSAFSRGEPDPLPELEVQYADYAAWQREWLVGEALRASLDDWKQRLEGVPTVLELPTDRPRPAVRSYRGAVHRFEVPSTLADTLAALSRREAATPFIVLLAAFQVLLSRYSGQDDLVVGSPIAGRNRSELEPLVGLFVNTLALRGDLSGDPTFRELLGRVRESTLRAYGNHELPFERLIEELRVERDLSRSPLVQVMFLLQSAGDRPLEMRGLRVSGLDVARGSAKFDLMLGLLEAPRGLVAAMEYDLDLFDSSTIVRMGEHFLSLLEGIAAAPQGRISALPLLAAAEREQVLGEWNATERAYPAGRTLHGLFEDQVRRDPEAVAVRFEGEELSYAALNTRANRLANYLRERGVGPEARVGLCVERSVELVVAVLAVLKAGGAYVPLDPQYPRELLAYVLADAEVPVLLTQERLREALPAHGAEVVRLDADWPEIAARSGEDPASGASPESLAYVIYTSGSTGRPKGVMNAHRGVVNRLLWMQEEYGLDASDAVLQKTPYSFDVSVWELLWPLLAGARLVVARPGGHRDPLYLAGVIEAERVTTVHFVPSMLQAFLEEPAAGDCRSLRRVVCSGEALSAQLRDRFFGRVDAELHNLYGPTEAAIDVTAWRCDAERDGHIVPIGSPVANTRVYVRDGRGDPLPAGVPGELYLGGVQVARGYLGRPDLTAERFVPDPFSAEPGARLYRTGDRVRWLAGGALEFLGRTDHQVKIRGFRVEPGEVEGVLAEHPAVREAAVLARATPGGDPRLVAYVVAGEEPPAPEALRAHLRARLPEHMVPGAYVMLGALPLNASGKLDRRALPEPEAPAVPHAGFAEPGSELERTLQAVWRDVLRLDRVGVDDNFFDLGGHSLLVVRVLRELSGSFPGLFLVDLFMYPTIRSLARFLEGGSADGELAAVGRASGETRRGRQGQRQKQKERRQAAANRQQEMDA